MDKMVQRLVASISFDDTGTLREEGSVGLYKESNLDNGTEHLSPVGDFRPATVEMAAVGPTGPNPTQPQQIPHDARQGAGGVYEMPGRVLVGEVTRAAEVRIDAAGLGEADIDAEAKAAKALAEARDLMSDGNNDDDALVAGTVAEVTAELGGKTDVELDALRAAEVDREKPRAGVLRAIDAEKASR